ncbi:hypothetical protein B0H12DRAFT_1231374 [Mycena haematopus]|nr:hypothetical protein B0H12DRAFT_1231374 [Mycena haematopus]
MRHMYRVDDRIISASFATLPSRVYCPPHALISPGAVRAGRRREPHAGPAHNARTSALLLVLGNSIPAYIPEARTSAPSSPASLSINNKRRRRVVDNTGPSASFLASQNAVTRCASYGSGAMPCAFAAKLITAVRSVKAHRLRSACACLDQKPD